MPNLIDCLAVRQGVVQHLHELPETTGVYCFVSRKNRARYIGKAGGERLRVEATRSFYGRDKGVPGDRILWFETANGHDAAILEKWMILNYNPARNGVERTPKPTDRLRDLIEFLVLAFGLVGGVKLLLEVIDSVMGRPTGHRQIA